MTLQEICDELRTQCDPIAKGTVQAWREIGRREVWFALPQEVTFDSLPDLLSTLAGCSLCTDFARAEARALAEIAAKHGDTRRREGFEEKLIYTEYLLLRRTLWDFIRERAQGDHAATAIVRLDAGITFASMASLRGFHREAFEMRGDWPRALERLLKEWPLTNGS